MNKKGQDMGLLMEWIIALVIIVLLIFVILPLGLNFVSKEDKETKELASRFNSDLFLINLLRSDYKDIPLTDIIISDYLSDDYTQTKEAINTFLTGALGEKMCWEADISGNIIRNRDSCRTSQEIIGTKVNSTIYMPSPNQILVIKFKSR